MLNDPVREELVSFLDAIGEDEHLRAWLLSLHQLTPEARREELSRMAEEMRAGGEDPAIIDALWALSRPEVYAAAYQTTIELHGEPAAQEE